MLDHPDNIAPRYYCRLKKQDGTNAAWVDDWDYLEFEKTVNGEGYFIMAQRGDDERIDLFELDGQLEVWRSIPGVALDWYREFVGLFQNVTKETQANGKTVWVATGAGPNTLLERRVIAYEKDSAGASKIGAGESVIKAYVEENLGILATVANGRAANGVCPRFSVEPDSGAGASWEGERSWRKLADVVREIAKATDIDFEILHSYDPEQGVLYNFITHEDYLGDDRTYKDINPNTGRKMNGFLPVLFSVPKATVQQIRYSYERIAEITRAFVVGESGGVELPVYRESDLIGDSPWNLKENAKRGFNQATLDQLYTQADEELAAGEPRETFTFTPMQQPSLLYGRDYFLGDFVSAMYGTILRDKRITGVRARVEKFTEALTLTFSDLPTL